MHTWFLPNCDMKISLSLFGIYTLKIFVFPMRFHKRTYAISVYMFCSNKEKIMKLPLKSGFYHCISSLPLHCPETPTTSSDVKLNGPRQANLVLIAYASSKGSGEPAHPRSLARTSAARSYKQWVKRNLQTESQIRGPSEWLDMRS